MQKHPPNHLWSTSKLLWLYLTVTPSFEIQNKHKTQKTMLYCISRYATFINKFGLDMATYTQKVNDSRLLVITKDNVWWRQACFRKSKMCKNYLDLQYVLFPACVILSLFWLNVLKDEEMMRMEFFNFEFLWHKSF